MLNAYPIICLKNFFYTDFTDFHRFESLNSSFSLAKLDLLFVFFKF